MPQQLENLEKLLESSPPALRVHPLPRFPEVSRDLALIVPQKNSYREIYESLWKAGQPLLREAKLFDLYQGKQIPTGKKSFAFRLSFFDPERTLTEKEVTAAVDRIVGSLQKQFDASLRS